MKAWSRLRWLGGRLPSGLVAGGFVAVLVAACWGLSYGLGGAGNAPPLWFLLPIMVVGARFGLVGALLVAGVSGILAGPLLPDSVARHLALELELELTRSG
jgi:hypothetical protein